MAYLTPQHAEQARRTYANNIRALGREHPRRIPLYCKLLAEVATTITGDPAQDGKTANDVLRMADQLDRPRNQCLATVIAAIPKTEPAQRALAEAAPCRVAVSLCHARLRPSRGP